MRNFKNILCVVDPKKACSPALERAVALAENDQAKLVVALVVERILAGIGVPVAGPVSTDLQELLVERHTTELDELVDLHRKQIEIETMVLSGRPYLEIVRDVLRNGRDLVIKVAGDKEWLERLFGSDDMQLLRKCPCPVWLTKPQAPMVYQRILAAVDVDDTYPPHELEPRHALNLQVIEMASSLALADSAELHIVYVWNPIGESALRHSAFMKAPESQVDAYVEQERGRLGKNLDDLMREASACVGQDVMDCLRPRLHMVRGKARQEVPAIANRIEADVLVMGTVARTGVQGFIMGNTAEYILNQIDCSVLAVKPPGFVVPMTMNA